MDDSTQEYLRVYNALDKLIALTRSTVKDPIALSDFEKLQRMLKGNGMHLNSLFLVTES